MNQFEIEVVPEGTLLITEHNDKPGVISAISAVLGESNINISRMQVGVPDSNDKAMAVISVSSPLSDALLQKVKDLSFVNAAVLIDL
jgi:ACT domain.